MEQPQDLNAAQWQAVRYDGGHLLIVAGPGTGKTHTLTRRIARVVREIRGHVTNSSFELGTCPLISPMVLAITFTNKAAEEMRERLIALDVPQSKAFVGTFHSFCLKLLRDFWQDTALPKDFKVALPEDIQGFKKETLERISLMKSTRLVIEPDEDYKAYQRYLRQNAWIDFDDILREALDLLENPDIAGQIRGRYCHVFVDEYQDSNAVQNALLKNLICDGAILTAIGDPNQSIYAFRGSDARLCGRFKEDFPGAIVLHLNENYRSYANLLTASSQVIEIRGHVTNSFFELGTCPLICAMHGEGRLVIHAASTDRAEADYIAAQIEKMIGGMDMRSAIGAQRSFGDFAILYRLNAQRHVIAQALDHLGIPYQILSKPPKPEIYSDEQALGQYEESLDYNVEKVSLLTLHAAKGLEFPVVFVIGCEEKILPLDLEGMKSTTEEERRLFYVGMTRAKECLYLTHAARRQIFGKTAFHQPSPFLSDIQENLKAYEAGRKPKKPKPVPVDGGQIQLF